MDKAAEFAPYIKYIIQIFTVVTILIAGWEIYKKLTKVEVDESIRNIAGNVWSHMETSQNTVTNWWALVGAILFIAGTARFMLDGMPIIYIVFLGIGLINYLAGTYWKIPKMKWSSLFFMVGILAGCAMTFFVKMKVIYYVLMGAGLFVMFVSVIIHEIFKPAE